MSLSQVRKIALDKGYISKANEIANSTRKGKRFMILQNDKWIHFGAYPFTGKGTYLDHNDDNIRKAWRARHSKIMKDGKPAYQNRNSPEFYSWNILW